MLHKIVSEPTPALSSVASDVPSALEAIVAKATARNPDDRYATAQEMRLALEQYLAGQVSSTSTADVGQTISQYFEEDRRFLRERVRDSVSGTPPGGASQRETRGLAAPSSLSTTVGPSASVTGEGTLQKMQQSSRRRKVIVAAVFSAVALVIVAALWVVPQMSADTHSAAAGTLAIESVPTSASVRLDGALLGATPLTTRAASGPHQVTVSKEGFVEISSLVEAKNGETVKLSLVLSPVPATPTAPEPVASRETESDKQVSVQTDNRAKQGNPPPRAQWRPAPAKAAPEARPAPSAPNIQIIDDSAETKVKVDVIE